MEKNEFNLDIEKNIGLLLQNYPEFQNDIKRSTNKHGEIATLTLSNDSNPRFPLIVTMYGKYGIYLDLGLRNSIIEDEIGITDHFLDMISLVLADKVYVTNTYKNQECYINQNPSVTRLNYDTDKTDHEWLDDLLEYNVLLKKLQNPVPWYRRPFVLYRGIIETSNWSGSAYKLIKR
ncbi:MAG TPA: hypothetical protein DEP23_17135 [Ruminococcaceae bacterium]|nr:hypothetical protein [Oscillospiraceae bacterium]